ncbi:MAG TPA: hypothetical protein VGE01_12805 [Fimbriimonas sp.]
MAAVEFDPETGQGFVGKGDVQLAFGWNNADFQRNVGSVVFTYESSSLVTGVCEWTTEGNGKESKTHQKKITSGSAIYGTLKADQRVRNQVTGIELTGYAANPIVTEGSDTYDNKNYPMVVGGPCPGNPGNGSVWVSVTEGGSAESGLYAAFGAEKKLVWPPAPATP